jgi:GT2 family glycosyltransferase
MIEFMDKNNKVGIASCQLVSENGDIQPSGGFFPTLSRVFTWMFFLDDLPLVGKLVKPFHPHAPRFYTRNPWYQEEHFQDWVTGAFFLIRKDVIADIGFLDEKFFMYVEEMEYCYRAQKAGWQVVYIPITKIIHFGGKSSTSKNALVGEYRGLKYFYAKHEPFWKMFFLRFFLKAGAIFRILLFGIMKRNKEAKEAYVEALRIV